MRYKVSDIEKIFGISPTTTHYFEKHGIVCPARDEANNYRYYSAFDLNKLFIYMVYRNLEFPMSEAIQLMSGSSIGYLEAQLSAQISKVTEMQQHLNRVQYRLEYYRQLFARYEDAVVQLIESRIPPITFLRNQMRDHFLFGHQELAATRRCMEMPEACLPMLHFELGVETQVSYGYGVLRDSGAADPLMEHGVCLGGEACLYTIIRRSSKKAMRQVLSPLLQTLRSEDTARLSGQAYGHVFHEEKTQDDVIWHMEIWLPLLPVDLNP